jgi:hypothetical protein
MEENGLAIRVSRSPRHRHRPFRLISLYTFAASNGAHPAPLLYRRFSLYLFPPRCILSDVGGFADQMGAVFLISNFVYESYNLGAQHHNVFSRIR